MNPSILEQRLKDLEDNIRGEYKLLKEYEDALLYATDPKTRSKYQQEIASIKDTAKSHQEEYEILAARLSNKPAEEERLDGKLGEISHMLEAIIGGQRVLRNEHATIRSDLATVRRDILDRYKVGEKSIVSEVMAKLDINQTTVVQTLLNGVEANQLSSEEMEGILAALRKYAHRIPDNKVKSVLDLVDTPGMNLRHRLKVAIPLIPQILPFLPSVDYEGEIELDTGFDTKAMWQYFKKMLLGKQ